MKLKVSCSEARRLGYASDARIKRDLRSIGNQGKLRLRVFDESHEDHKPWKDGGLRFGIYGSNDGAWYFDEQWKDPVSGEICEKRPVIVVEGSYGTERGNIGSAQYARFHHALGPVMRGLVGVYLIPKRSFYYRDNIEHEATWRLDLDLGCLGASEIHAPGQYLMIDAYNLKLLKELVQSCGFEDESKKQELIMQIKKEMKDYAEATYLRTYGTSDPNAAFSAPRRNFAYNNERIGKILRHNVKAFTDPRYRNGHIIVGEGLLLRYWARKEVDLILPRFTVEDCKMLDKREQKEWTLLRSRGDVRVVTFDDLVFGDKELEVAVASIRDKLPLLGENLRKMNAIVKKMKEQFSKGVLKVRDDLRSVRMVKEPRGLEAFMS